MITPAQTLDLPKIANSKKHNIVFILLDDQRYDAMGFLDSQPFIKTPNMDRIARGGAYLPNAYVTLETRNLISEPEHKNTVDRMREQLFDIMEKTGGMYIPLKANRWGQQNLRREDKAKPAEFPPQLVKKP